MKKKIFLTIGFALLIGFIANWSIIIYGVRQLKGQLAIIYNTKPVTEILNDSSIPDSIKIKLKLIEEVRKYAIDSLGLKNTENYQAYYDQKGKPVLWVLTASEPFSMKAYKWKYPFLGKLSYKGFFSKEAGEAEEKQFMQKGYDTDLSPVSAWSTLGWFRDPILSGMLKRKEGSLAELIIHEMTHATLYVKSDVTFNENLATFIGEKGAQKFLSERMPEETDDYNQRLYDNKLYSSNVVHSVSKLDSLYKDSHFLSLTRKEKYKAKYKMIASILSDMNKLPYHKPEKYRWNFINDKLPGNTWFLSFSDYHEAQPMLEQIYADSCKSDVKALVAYFKTKYGK
ncbi:MAG: aminopeptidase [Bacteroidetes bacterium]|nr:aminopeptidase [Bacteroidota bacterium]